MNMDRKLRAIKIKDVHLTANSVKQKERSILSIIDQTDGILLDCESVKSADVEALQAIYNIQLEALRRRRKFALFRVGQPLLGTLDLVSNDLPIKCFEAGKSKRKSRSRKKTVSRGEIEWKRVLISVAVGTLLLVSTYAYILKTEETKSFVPAKSLEMLEDLEGLPGSSRSVGGVVSRQLAAENRWVVVSQEKVLAVVSTPRKEHLLQTTTDTNGKYFLELNQPEFESATSIRLVFLYEDESGQPKASVRQNVLREDQQTTRIDAFIDTGI